MSNVTKFTCRWKSIKSSSCFLLNITFEFMHFEHKLNNIYYMFLYELIKIAFDLSCVWILNIIVVTLNWKCQRIKESKRKKNVWIKYRVFIVCRLDIVLDKWQPIEYDFLSTWNKFSIRMMILPGESNKKIFRCIWTSLYYHL